MMMMMMMMMLDHVIVVAVPLDRPTTTIDHSTISIDLSNRVVFDSSTMMAMTVHNKYFCYKDDYDDDDDSSFCCRNNRIPIDHHPHLCYLQGRNRVSVD
jgi:hypothetical protein